MIVVLRAVVLSALLILPATFAAGDEAQDALVAEGVKAYDDGDYQKAKDILLPLAEAGHPKAMNMIGLMYEFIRGYSQNTRKACDWYEKSANAGYVSAQRNLAICYYWGDGRLRDEAQAIHWYRQAGEQGNKNAQAFLTAYFSSRERNEYLYWAQKAAQQGSVFAKAVMWDKGDKDLVSNLSWIDRVCIIVAVGWLKKPTDYCD